MSVTALLFPGLNCMRRALDFVPLLQLPGFGERWAMVHTAFADSPDFAAFDRALWSGDIRTLHDREHLHRLALAVATLQVTLAEALAHRGVQADWVCGWSAGDVARTLHAGSATFRDLMALTRSLPDPLPGTGELDGTTAVAVAPDAPEGKAAGRAQLQREPVTACWLSDRVAMLAGNAQEVAGAKRSLGGLGWRCHTLVDCAMHTARRAPLAAMLHDALAAVRLRPPQLGLFSSIEGRPLHTAAELRAELSTNVAARYDFAAAIGSLRRDHGVTRFVDVGPGSTAAHLLRHCDPPLHAEAAALLINRCPRATA